MKIFGKIINQHVSEEKPRNLTDLKRGGGLVGELEHADFQITHFKPRGDRENKKMNDSENQEIKRSTINLKTKN